MDQAGDLFSTEVSQPVTINLLGTCEKAKPLNMDTVKIINQKLSLKQDTMIQDLQILYKPFLLMLSSVSPGPFVAQHLLH